MASKIRLSISQAWIPATGGGEQTSAPSAWTAAVLGLQPPQPGTLQSVACGQTEGALGTWLPSEAVHFLGLCSSPWEAHLIALGIFVLRPLPASLPSLTLIEFVFHSKSGVIPNLP